MTTWFTRFRIAQRLQLISAAFLVPILVMAFLIVKTINKDIAFATLETAGVQYLQPLSDLLDALGESRLAAQRAAAGDKGAAAELERQAQVIDAAFAALDTVHQQLGRTSSSPTPAWRCASATMPRSRRSRGRGRTHERPDPRPAPTPTRPSSRTSAP